jgi:hypothetical protein
MKEDGRRLGLFEVKQLPVKKNERKRFDAPTSELAQLTAANRQPMTYNILNARHKLASRSLDRPKVRFWHVKHDGIRSKLQKLSAGIV